MKLYKSMGTLFVFSMLALVPTGCEEDYMSITNPQTEQKAKIPTPITKSTGPKRPIPYRRHSSSDFYCA